MKWTAKNIALCAVLASLALGLSTLEGLFPISLLVPLPGVKLGLANIVTVFALYELGAVPALVILFARCGLGSLFAGNVSALLFSMLGGLCAMLVMIGLKHCRKLSIYGVSIGGAAAHNQHVTAFHSAAPPAILQSAGGSGLPGSGQDPRRCGASRPPHPVRPGGWPP